MSASGVLVDPPLLDGEVEIDLTDCYVIDPLATIRSEIAVEERLRIERLIRERRQDIERIRAERERASGRRSGSVGDPE